MMILDAVLQWLAQTAPLHLAEEWDNVGLLLGDPNQPVERVMTCLGVTNETANEAVERGANVIVTHHPVMFRGVKRLVESEPEGRVLRKLIRANVAVYSAHTAFDNAPGGINDTLAERLGLHEVRPLQSSSEVCKIIVFVPEKDVDAVSDALFRAGAGRIGAYRECSFRVLGSGTFFGGDETNPAVGQRGRRETVSEYRLEVICPTERIDGAVRAMRGAHSYEEPAFDIVPLQPYANRTNQPGIGRLGRLAAPVVLGEFVALVKKVLSIDSAQFVGRKEQPVQKAAIVCGAGRELLERVLDSGADILLTGELRFHDCLAAEARGMALVLPGHYASERFGMEQLAQRLAAAHPAIEVWVSRSERDVIANG
jgi:dinuclear metal center YbgI/SA1388 family protein